MTIRGPAANGGWLRVTESDRAVQRRVSILLNIVSSMSRGLRWVAVAVLYCACLTTAKHADAGEVEERRVRISLEIFPRIVAVDQDLRSKLSTTGALRLFVLFEHDGDGARHSSGQMKNSFTNIGGHAVEFVVQNAQQAVTAGMEQPAAVFLSDLLPDDLFAAVMKAAIESHVLVFSPFAGDVERGATAGIAISSRIQPYFNV